MKKLIIALMLLNLVFYSIYPSTIFARSGTSINNDQIVPSVQQDEYISLSIKPSKPEIVPGDIFEVSYTLRNNDINKYTNIQIIDQLTPGKIKCFAPYCTNYEKHFEIDSLEPGETKVVKANYQLQDKTQLNEIITNAPLGARLVYTAPSHSMHSYVWSVKSIAPKISNISFGKVGDIHAKSQPLNVVFDVSDLTHGVSAAIYLQNQNGDRFLVKDNFGLQNGGNLLELDSLNSLQNGYYKVFIEMKTSFHIDNSGARVYPSQLSTQEIYLSSSSISVKEPNGGQRFIAGDQIQVQWETKDLLPNEQNITQVFLARSASQNGTLAYIIYDGISKEGITNVNYTIPAWIELGNDYKVIANLRIGTEPKIEVIADSSDSTFSIAKQRVDPTPTPTQTPTPTITITPTITPTLTPTLTPTPTPDRTKEPDYPDCRSLNIPGCFVIGNYKGEVVNAPETTRNTDSFEFTLAQDTVVYLRGFVKEGHPEDDCVNFPTKPRCTQKQINENLNISVDGTQVYGYNDRGADLNEWYEILGNDMVGLYLTKGKHKLIATHPLDSNGIGSIGYKASLMGIPIGN